MERIFSVFILAFGMVLVAGCATPTPYQRAAGTYGSFGYSDRLCHPEGPLPHDTHAVCFHGSTATDLEEASRFADRRALEVCQQLGFANFFVVGLKQRVGLHKENVKQFSDDIPTHYSTNPSMWGTVTPSQEGVLHEVTYGPTVEFTFGCTNKKE